MGYRIEYRTIRKLRNAEQRRSLRGMFIGLFFLLFLTLVCSCWPEGKHIISELVFLGRESVVASAMENLVSQLENGAGIYPALAEFCSTVCEEIGSGVY